MKLSKKDRRHLERMFKYAKRDGTFVIGGEVTTNVTQTSGSDLRSRARGSSNTRMLNTSVKYSASKHGDVL